MDANSHAVRPAVCHIIGNQSNTIKDLWKVLLRHVNIEQYEINQYSNNLSCLWFFLSHIRLCKHVLSISAWEMRF